MSWHHHPGNDSNSKWIFELSWGRHTDMEMYGLEEFYLVPQCHRIEEWSWTENSGLWAAQARDFTVQRQKTWTSWVALFHLECEEVYKSTFYGIWNVCMYVYRCLTWIKGSGNCKQPQICAQQDSCLSPKANGWNVWHGGLEWPTIMCLVLFYFRKSSIYFLKDYIYSSSVCGQLVEASSHLSHVGPGNWPQVVRVGYKVLYPPSYLQLQILTFI